MVGAVVIPPVLELLYNAYGFAGALPREGMDASQALAAPQATLMTQIANGIFKSNLDWNMLGLGIYLPPTIGMTLVLGALLGWLIQRAIRRYGERNGKDWVAAAQERGLLLASGLIVGESLMGLALAAVIGFSGSDAPLALVGHGFALAMWLGLVAFAALFAFFYKRVLRS